MCFFVFAGITICGSEPLMLGVCKAASPWSQICFPDSHIFVVILVVFVVEIVTYIATLINIHYQYYEVLKENTHTSTTCFRYYIFQS